MAKLTKKDYFNILKSAVVASDRADKEELVAFIDHELDLLSARNATKKPTATQRANEELKVELLKVLKNLEEPITIASLRVRCPKFADLTSQKLSPLLHQLKEEGKVKIDKDTKKRTVFSAVKS